MPLLPFQSQIVERNQQSSLISQQTDVHCDVLHSMYNLKV